jgi:hypothetical protein
VSDGLFCYTTGVAAEKSVSEIIGMLARARARAIMQDYDGAGNVTAVSFRTVTQFGEMAFRLPVDVQATQQVLKDQYKAGKVDRRYANDSAHARRVAWRILKNWCEVQLAMIAIGNVKVEQVFLAFAQRPDGKTVYEALTEHKFQGLALPAPEVSR